MSSVEVGGAGLSSAVQWHIESMYSGSAHCAESNTWLTAFVERAPEAWRTLLELLVAGAATTENAKFFACQGLFLKLTGAVTPDGRDIWESCGDASMRQKLLSTVFGLLTGPATSLGWLVRRRLCLVLVHLILRIGLTDYWKDPIADVFRALSSQQNLLCLVEVLTLLPMELETNKYCPPTRIVLMATALRHVALPRVLNLTKQLLHNGGEREQRAAWKCLVGWCQSSARVGSGVPLLIRLREGHQRLYFEHIDEPPATPATNASTDASGVMPQAYAESLGLTLVEYFQSGIGIMALKAMANGCSALDIDMFSDIIETFAEILMNPSPSSLKQWLIRDRGRVLYDAHCVCLSYMLEQFLRRWRRVHHVPKKHANLTIVDQNSCSDEFFRGGILEGERGGAQYSSRVLALLSIVGEHHRGAWLRSSGPQGGQLSSLDAFHFVQLILTCTEHPHPKVASEALQFWDMFTDLRTAVDTPWAPENFMQWLARDNILIRVIGSIIKGCTLPADAARWECDDLSEVREAHEEYRLHALDTLHTVASSWPLHMEPDKMSSMVCATHLSGTPNINTIEAVFWVVSGIIDATDAIEDLDYDSDEFTNNAASIVTPSLTAPAFGRGEHDSNSMCVTAADPWTELLKFVAIVAAELNDKSSPYLLRSSSRLISRLMPIITQNPEFAGPILFHLCSKALFHDASRVDGAEVFFELCRNRSCSRQIIRMDPALTQTASILFTPRNSPGGECVCLMRHLRAFPVTQLRVIDAFVSLQLGLPLSMRLPIAESTIQQLLSPLNLATQCLNASSLAASASSRSLAALRQKNLASEMIKRDLYALARGILSIPMALGGITMIDRLITSVIHPILTATDSNPSVIQGVSEIYKRISDLLEIEGAAQLKGARALAATLVHDICTWFCVRADAALLSALANVVSSCRDLLLWPSVVQALGNLRSQIQKEPHASCSDVHFEWVSFMDVVRRNAPCASLHETILKQILFFLKDARMLSLGLCFPRKTTMCSAHRSRGSILAEMGSSIIYTASVASRSSEEMGDLHALCVQLFSRSLMVFTSAPMGTQGVQAVATNAGPSSMQRWNRVPFSSAISKVIVDLLRGGAKELAQSAFQQALASELPNAFAPVILSDQMQRRVFDTLCRAANTPSTHKAKRLLRQSLREIQDFCKLEPRLKEGAVGKLSFFR